MPTMFSVGPQRYVIRQTPGAGSSELILFVLPARRLRIEVVTSLSRCSMAELFNEAAEYENH